MISWVQIQCHRTLSEFAKIVKAKENPELLFLVEHEISSDPMDIIRERFDFGKVEIRHVKLTPVAHLCAQISGDVWAITKE